MYLLRLFTAEEPHFDSPLLPLLFCFMALDVWLLHGALYEKNHKIYWSTDLGEQHEMYIALAKVLCKIPLHRL